MADKVNPDRFHGRVRGARHACAHDGCGEAGEFRAPNPNGRAPGPHGPGEWQWLCLDHVREFNTRYNFFGGMSRAEIEDAQMPLAGWATETRAFAHAGVDAAPHWADFHDPLDAISGRFKTRPTEARSDLPLTSEDRAALGVLSLPADADALALRARYSERVRLYHPDRNGGDRSHEKALQATIEAYQHLRKRHFGKG